MGEEEKSDGGDMRGEGKSGKGIRTGRNMRVFQ